MLAYPQGDLDVDVTQVLLAHRYTMVPGLEMDAYRQGRNMHGMVCPIDGAGEYFFSTGQISRLSPGQIALIPASAAYRVRAADGRPFEHYTVNFLGNGDTLPPWIPRSGMYVLSPKDPRKWSSLRKTRPNIQVFCGELSPNCPPEDLPGLQTIPGAGDYLPTWPRLALAEP